MVSPSNSYTHNDDSFPTSNHQNSPPPAFAPSFNDSPSSDQTGVERFYDSSFYSSPRLNDSNNDDPFLNQNSSATLSALPRDSLTPPVRSSHSRAEGQRLLESGSNYSNAATAKSKSARDSTRFKKLMIAAIVLGLIVAAVVAGVVVAVEKNKSSSASANLAAADQTSSSSTSSEPTSTGTATSSAVQPTATVVSNESRNQPTGGNGSIVYLDDGSSFIYNNSFGGYWNAIPFNDTARAQSHIPPLNEAWDFNTNRIAGVNLGGWLVLEPFITPAMFEPFNPGEGGWSATPPTVVDEYTLSVALGSNLSVALEEHYSTFITEKDFAEIAGAGLNWIRLPVPYWMIENIATEPFTAGAITYRYFLLALSWARKYGSRVNLDLHAIPGSQNGYNHSSKGGTANFLQGVMGYANYQRTRNYIRTLGELISTPQYENVVVIFSILNEARPDYIGKDVLKAWNLEMYRMLREITGIGRGFYIAFGDSLGFDEWTGYLEGADRIMIDTHPYLIFTAPNNDPPTLTASNTLCGFWRTGFGSGRSNFGLFIAGEWSLAINDCGKWLNNVGDGSRYDGSFYGRGEVTPAFAAIGTCEPWDDYGNYTAERKADFLTIANANIDAFGDNFFWTWKTGFSPQLGRIANPQWNYQLGLANGWIPTDPRSAVGTCQTLNPGSAPLATPTYTPGSGVIVPAEVALYPWPPVEIGSPPLAVAALPSYTPTGSIITLAPGPTPTLLPIGYGSMNLVGIAGNGWNDPTDTSLFFVEKAGCTYLDPCEGLGGVAPPICA